MLYSVRFAAEIDDAKELRELASGVLMIAIGFAF